MVFGLTGILFTIAHSSESPDRIRTRRPHELLGTDSARDRCQYARMKKKGRKLKVPARTTIASIIKEMQEPRLAKSVRDDPRYQVVLAAEEPVR
jgi:hypothetical protein